MKMGLLSIKDVDVIYYNDNDKYIVKWLKYLIDQKIIPKGDVDDRDIREIKPSELEKYTQCHFFAGIGGWPYALKLANWRKSEPVWTGSCPCQPFSNAGKSKNLNDERHLWPAFRWLIAQCKPATVFGEQVAGKLGSRWLSGVRFDLEAMGYAVGAANLCAAGVGSPQIRQRLFYVGYASDKRFKKRIHNKEVQQKKKQAQERKGFELSGSSFWQEYQFIECKDKKIRRIPLEPLLFPLAHGIPNRTSILRGVGNAIVPQVGAVFVKSFLETIKS